MIKPAFLSLSIISRLAMFAIPAIFSGCAPSESIQANADPAAANHYSVPESLDDGWPTASLIEQGIDRAPILEMLTRIRT